MMTYSISPVLSWLKIYPGSTGFLRFPDGDIITFGSPYAYLTGMLSAGRTMSFAGSVTFDYPRHSLKATIEFGRIPPTVSLSRLFWGRSARDLPRDYCSGMLWQSVQAASASHTVPTQRYLSRVALWNQQVERAQRRKAPPPQDTAQAKPYPLAAGLELHPIALASPIPEPAAAGAAAPTTTPQGFPQFVPIPMTRIEEAMSASSSLAAGPLQLRAHDALASPQRPPPGQPAATAATSPGVDVIEAGPPQDDSGSGPDPGSGAASPKPDSPPSSTPAAEVPAATAAATADEAQGQDQDLVQIQLLWPTEAHQQPAVTAYLAQHRPILAAYLRSGDIPGRILHPPTSAHLVEATQEAARTMLEHRKVGHPDRHLWTGLPPTQSQCGVRSTDPDTKQHRICLATFCGSYLSFCARNHEVLWDLALTPAIRMIYAGSGILPSDTRYRFDRAYMQQQRYSDAEVWKYHLENIQRTDRKHRQQAHTTSH